MGLDQGQGRRHRDRLIAAPTRTSVTDPVNFLPPGPYDSGMALLIVLLLLMLIFGVGAVIEGLAWLFLIALGFLVVAGFVAYRTFGRVGR